MSQRPMFLAVVSVLMVVFAALGLLGLVVIAAMWNQPEFQQQLARQGTDLSPPTMIIAVLGCVAQIVAGLACWAGKNWGRLLYVVSTVAATGYALAVQNDVASIVPGMLATGVFLFGIYNRKSNAFMRGEPWEGQDTQEEFTESVEEQVDVHIDASDPYAAPTIRRVNPQQTSFVRQAVGYCLYVGGGFLIVMSSLFFGMRPPVPANAGVDPAGIMMGMSIGSAVIAAICVTLGAISLNRPSRLKSAGLCLLISAGVAAFMLTSMMASTASPQFKEQVPPEMADMYRDAWQGLAIAGFAGVVGALMFALGRRPSLST